MDTPKSSEISIPAVSPTPATAQVPMQRPVPESAVPAPSADSANAAFNEMLGSDLARLSNAKIVALRLLLNGQNDTTTARAVGKHPCTIARWKSEHPVFRRCLNTWRQAQRTSIIDGLFDLTEPALDAVRAKVLKGEDARLCLALLQFAARFQTAKLSPEPEPELEAWPGPQGYYHDQLAAKQKQESEANKPDQPSND